MLSVNIDLMFIMTVVLIKLNFDYLHINKVKQFQDPVICKGIIKRYESMTSNTAGE